MKKPIITLIVLCINAIVYAQTSVNHPSSVSRVSQYLIFQKFLNNQTFLLSSEASSDWNGFKDNPRSGSITSAFLPQNGMKGITAGLKIGYDSYGPFSEISFQSSIGVVKTSNRFRSGFYLDLIPGYSTMTINSASLNWYESEPQTIPSRLSKAFQLGFSSGFWLSFDHKRKALFYNFTSNDLLNAPDNDGFLFRLVSGKHQVTWLSRNESSRTETMYGILIAGSRQLVHDLSFIYFSPYYFYTGVSLNSLRNASLVSGIQIPLPGSQNSMLDFQYKFGYSLQSFGNRAGGNHLIAIRYLKEI